MTPLEDPTRLNIRLLAWYQKTGRILPWRCTNDPYLIWISEIILQQTRVGQGLPYYHAFSEQFPTISHLAKASETEVLKLWQGLGYYSRARNMLATAREIVEKFQGEFPTTYAGLLALKGVGPYTAAAIASFAFKLPHAVVDGNVSRVLSRLYNLHTPINSSSGKKEFQALADMQIARHDPSTYNQAIMELGALVCTPRKPLCQACPIQPHCLGFAAGNLSLLPVKLKGRKPIDRHMDFAVLESDHHFILRKRTKQDIWQGLHDFEALEGILNPDPPAVYKHIGQVLPDLSIEVMSDVPQQTYTHLLSHQRIHARFWRFRVKGEIDKNSIYLNVPKRDLDLIAVPKLIHQYFEDAGLI